MLSFKPVTLDTDAPDQEAVLVFRNGNLLAVLTRLSAIHGDLKGKWFLEAAFGEVPVVQPPVFESTEHFEEWVSRAS